MMGVKELRNLLERKKGRKEQLEKERVGLTQSIDILKKSLRAHEKAKLVIQTVGVETQNQLSYNISEVATLALDSVLDFPYELKLNFVEKRNKTECEIKFERNGISIDPFSGGGGAIDVASFALRVASWSMQSPRNRNVLILDEPFKHLKGEGANRKMLEMVKEVSDRLGIQIIMVSDERVSREATIEITDKLFETSMVNGVTRISH